MNYFILFLLLCLIIFTSTIKLDKPKKTDVISKEVIKQKNVQPKVEKKVKVSAKKKEFYSLLVPAIQKTHTKLMSEYISVLDDINSSKNLQRVEKLKKEYKVNNNKELLAALKPHPQSIVLAQAAIESAWGTSRFFNEANNVFGMWSANENELRIPAGEKRNGTKTIWLRKFNSVEDSIKAYYKLMATAQAYKEFRKVRFQTDDPFTIVKELNNYSELGSEYTQSISSVIKYNKLTQYDQ